ncbi:c-type cytochrome [Edaphobacter bradus]|uniref:c-type cytochrome n=1 Tax=Edaphobacter bradus TaxID=2259016 RepID=UPI0021E095B9|nr:cytochrome c [Edaphobacter bradus]
MRAIIVAIAISFSAPLVFAASDGVWLKRVPDQDRARINPYALDENAAAAGALLYKRNCASCHAADASGQGKRPSLRTTRVQHASDGELFWLLTNGNLGHGMPSWSRLPEDQRWQLTRYLHSLPLEETK